MLKSTGIIQYDDTDGHWVSLRVSQDLSDYYRTLIPKHERVIKPRWNAHITVVRGTFDVPKLRHWEDHKGEEVEFIYDSYLLNGYGYYWVNAWSKRLEDIRSELGLENTSRYALRPAGYDKTFHITIGKYEEPVPVGEAPEK